MRNLFILSILVVVTLLSCEEEGPLIILEESQLALVDTSFVSNSPILPVNKNVFFEEFSGVQCAACPGGAAELKSIVEANPERVVPVTAHSEFLALPYPGSVDLRTPDADLIANNLGPVSVKPSCFINRKIINSQRLVISLGSWSSIVSNTLNESTPVGINLEIIDVNESERIFRYRATLEYSSNAENHNLGFYLTESNIVAEQLDGSVRIPGYVHFFVLRKSITAFIGDPLTEDLVQNTVIIKEFEINLNDEGFDPNQEWDINQMEIVAFIREANDEIANAARVKIVE